MDIAPEGSWESREEGIREEPRGEIGDDAFGERVAMLPATL
jgi:hypothetical protein